MAMDYHIVTSFTDMIQIFEVKDILDIHLPYFLSYPSKAEM